MHLLQTRYITSCCGAKQQRSCGMCCCGHCTIEIVDISDRYCCVCSADCSDGSFGWYIMPTVSADMGCSSPSGPCDHFQTFFVYRTQWQLPASFTCRRCKLQWHYLTAHNCWPPCAPGNRGEVTCENAQVYQTCGQPQATYPEEFWNCADVSVEV